MHILAKKINILWLIEHIAREMDVACATASILKNKFGFSVEFQHIHLTHNIDEFDPELIVYPFFYGLNTGAGRFFKHWPNKKHLNLNWEQIYYGGVSKLKKPQDDIAKKCIFQNAWGDFYKKYLINNGVDSNNILINGNQAYQLYKEPYVKYYKTRDQLAEYYHLDGSKRWIFIPENYRWAFNSDQELKTKQKLGGNLSELKQMKDYCTQSLKLLLTWCHKTAKNNANIIILFRPKPITVLSEMIEFYKREVSTNIPTNLIFSKKETVREWILASDVIISSFSTTLIESSIANKPIAMVEPVPMPKLIKNVWNDYIPTLKSQQNFEAACVDPKKTTTVGKLKTWATSEMLRNGDAILNLSNSIENIIHTKKILTTTLITSQLNKNKYSPNLFFSVVIHQMKNLIGCITGKHEINFHENDTFTSNDVNLKISKWDQILLT